MAEISSAVAADGSVTVESPQTDPTPKSNADKGFGTTGTASKRKGAVTSKMEPPELDERGVVKTKWDNPSANPNLRKHVGESPFGEGNEISESSDD